MDAFTLLPEEERTIKILDDGFVKLVDVMPRYCPEGRTPEYRIVETARVSTGAGLKSVKEDEGLIRYLYKNKHTSPFEMVKFTFYIRCPLFVRTHLIRHRMSNINEYSQRYTEVIDDAFFRPSSIHEGLRTQDKGNHQSSNVPTTPFPDETIELVKEIEGDIENIFKKYHQLIKLGVAREVARFCLPQATYTELFYTMDLNNLLKFLALRRDIKHSQYETYVIADAMFNLIKPFVPTVIKAFEDFTLTGMTLSGK